ncbi:MAG: 4-hydroxy-3-methylbut-2-enyl diphosphate reductase [Verrucomicrobiota bacterium]|nr:4-hydroxy-3-methylbut-2-enyl diphosphate reductase [Verrucomicrobiota bacterium]
MKIIVAEHLGMCFGVRDAIAQAESLAAEAPLTILGELVHNPLVRERLRAQGVREHSLNGANNETTTRVMITAHGASDRKRAEWSAAGFAVSDGTCPLVRHAHTQLRLLVDAGYFPLVIGQAGHVEVLGLIGDFPEAHVINESENIARLPLHSRYGIIAQTTQPIDRVRKLVAEIRRARPRSEVRFVDTVCKPTKDRQRALLALITQTQLVLVVGGKQSNNTRQLVETCLGAGRRVVHIERPEELRGAWFDECKIVGVTAGTSTLPETVVAVVERLGEISRLAPNETNTTNNS